MDNFMVHAQKICWPQKHTEIHGRHAFFRVILCVSVANFQSFKYGLILVNMPLSESLDYCLLKTMNCKPQTVN